VIEEMLHMTLASNLLNALGGSPKFLNPAFVPIYPDGLPFGIGDHMRVNLRKCSMDQIKNTFMMIEKPEKPIEVHDLQLAAAGTRLEFDTIGAFYFFLQQKLEELGNSVFKGKPERQVDASTWFPKHKGQFGIRDVETAKAAISLIVDQGEGTTTDAFDSDGEPAHYYRFEQIVVGKTLVKAPNQKPPFGFDPGKPIVFDAAKVYAMDDDPALVKYAAQSDCGRAAAAFATSYGSLLAALNETFDGAPDRLESALGIMYELKVLANKALAIPAVYASGNAPAGVVTGLCFDPPASAKTTSLRDFVRWSGRVRRQ
jgi:hypothetical protein